MKDVKFREEVLKEIENCLWRLGEYTDGSDNSVFPNFNLNSHELEYGIQRQGDIILVETSGKTVGGERILAKVTVKLIKGGE